MRSLYLTARADRKNLGLKAEDPINPSYCPYNIAHNHCRSIIFFMFYCFLGQGDKQGRFVFMKS
jgi:hypothetical protein